MSIDKNNDMSKDGTKDSVDFGKTLDPVVQETPDISIDSLQPEARHVLERELLRRLSKEKHRLAAELEIKFKEAAHKRLHAQEVKIKQAVQQDRERFEKALKEKYNRIMKTMLQEREAEILAKVQQKHRDQDLQLRQELEQTKGELLIQRQQAKDELLNQQQKSSMEIAEAKMSAKHEQEQISRSLYENIIKTNREEIIKQTETKLATEYAVKENELAREYELKFKKQTAKLMNSYEEKLRAALFEQEQAFSKSNSEQLARQSELFNHRIQQEIETAVAAATSKLELEFVKEKQALNALIENMRPELEANRLRLRVEVEKEVREEFELKFAEYKQKVEQAKTIELEALLTSEKQRLAEAMQEENMVVLRYKEREIRETCQSAAEQDIHAKIQQRLTEQEKRLRDEHEKMIQEVTKKLQADHALQLQAEVIQERARITDKSTSEKKLLLQQQQTNLQEQFASELAHKLSMQAQSFKQQYEVQIRDLEVRLQEAISKQGLRQAFDQAMSSAQPAQEHSLPALVQAPIAQAATTFATPTFDAKFFDSEKQAALRAQEQELKAQFAEQLRMARAEWESEQQAINHGVSEDELIACEKRLRLEFQAILEQQRLQAAANFAKQRDVEIRGTVARYKQKILNELEANRVNDLAAAEEALKEQYAARMQQHAELARVEIERTKEQLLAEQSAKIKQGVDLQIEVVQKEQDRRFAAYAEAQDKKLRLLVEEEHKKLHVKFAQDKANLIKDLTAKFTREKHIAMSKYETELREKLYKEMVKQKDFIQSKFTHTQEAALNEQRRRLEAQHKHEIERIKQGYFDPDTDHASKHAEVIAERNVEQLADRILSKFQRD